jgi:phosphonate transport system permease protein
MEHIQQAYNQRPKNTLKRVLIWGLILLLVAFSLPYSQFKGFEQNGWVVIVSILKALFNPNWDALLDFSRAGVPFLMLETVAIAFLGTFIGMILSIPFAFLTARNIVPAWISAIGTFLITVIRTFPPVVYGLMLIRIAGPGAFTGVLTLSITSIGMISKMFIEVIEELDQGIIESLDSSGCNTIQKIQYGIVPQLLGNFASISIYRFEINVKNASILGLVGAGGIGAPLIFAMAGFRWADAGALLWGLVILVVVIEMISTRLRRKLG